MLKKIEKAYLLLEENVEMLRCPICHGKFQLAAYALKCENNHTYKLIFYKQKLTQSIIRVKCLNHVDA